MSVAATPSRTRGRAWMLLGVFTLSILLSAFLLFSVQPMFTKLVLPLLGGSSSVWNTAMVFFQAMLLGGYIYAHVISRYLKLGWQVICHTIVLSCGLFFLPLAIASGWTPPEGGAQAYWLIALFAASVGVPFFAISANSPLLQRWFSRTNDKDADDPYFLYAASNLGSLSSLCLYPVLFEPMLRLQTQTHIWAVGYGALIAIIALAGLWGLKHPKTALEDAEAASVIETGSRVSAKTKLFWVFLAFIPSSLMLGVTTFMSSTIASVPFLWIMPLALYLLTFIIVFAKKPIVTTAQLARLFPAVILLAIIAGFGFKKPVVLLIAISLICYFLIALMSHSRLADSRPKAQHLTEFYIWMSVGGVLGGLFNALIAPVIFSDVHEYIIVLIIANLVVPKVTAQTRRSYTPLQGLIFCLLPAWGLYILAVSQGAKFHFAGALFGSAAVFGLTYMFGRGKAMWAGLALLGGFIMFAPTIQDRPIFKDRSFYSVLTVKKMELEYGPVHVFQHGDTVHNVQFRDPDKRRIPLVYYGPGNTFDLALQAVRKNKGDLNVAMIGLGAGAMACYERPGDKWTYMEIDQAVVDMAMDPQYFSYMEDCSFDKKVLVGDARFTITELAPKSQDFLIIDAFSSNSIPAHLLTVEALEIYRNYLTPDGLMFFHTSNRSMDVSSVVVAVAEKSGLDTRFIDISDFSGQAYADTYSHSAGVLVGRKDDLARVTAGDQYWQRLKPSPYIKPWTDDYSSVIGPLRSNMFGDYEVVPAQ